MEEISAAVYEGLETSYPPVGDRSGQIPSAHTKI